MGFVTSKMNKDENGVNCHEICLKLSSYTCKCMRRKLFLLV